MCPSFRYNRHFLEEPFQAKQEIYRQDGKKFTNPKMSKTSNKKEDFKGNWNEAWRILKLPQEELESKEIKLEPKYGNSESKEPKEVKLKHEEVTLERKEVRVQSQLQLEFEQFKKRQLMNILPKINGNFGTEKEDENIENDQLNEAWRMIKQSQEKLEHKEVQVHARFKKKHVNDNLLKLNGNFCVSYSLLILKISSSTSGPTSKALTPPPLSSSAAIGFNNKFQKQLFF